MADERADTAGSASDQIGGAGRAASVVLGVDVGGTMIKALAVRNDGHVVLRARTPTAAQEGSKAVIARIEAFCADLADGIAGQTGLPPSALGLAVPGVVDETAGVARFAANIGWQEAPLGELLSQRLGVPVTVRNDVRAAGLAEARLGAARGSRDFLLLQIGTGIAGALVLDGRPYSGAHALGGEFGHVIVAPGGAACRCGARGCLETVASAAAVAGRYMERSGGGGALLVDAAEVIRRSAGGEACAREVWGDAVRALATVLAWSQNMLDPELVVLGGGLAQAGAALTDPLRRELGSQLTFQRLPRLAVSELGDEAGCLGAAMTAFEPIGFGLRAFVRDIP